MATSGDSETSPPEVQLICNSCQQDGEQKDAEYYCEECTEYLCSGCNKAHMRLQITRGHKVNKVNVVPDTPPELLVIDKTPENKPCNTDGDDVKASHYRRIQTVPSQNNQDVILDLSPQSISKVNVKVANDEDVSRITGCTFLSSGELLLCDHNNKNIKLSDKSLTVSDSIKVFSRPWDVAVVNKKTAIVTLPNAKQLQYVNLVPKLSLGSWMSTKQNCWGIVVVNKVIYITCHGGYINPEEDVGIRVLDLRGNELKKIGINRDGSQFLQRPFYIAVNRDENKLYVTDFRTKEIICISPSDNIIYKLKDSDIDRPYGVYVDSQDNLVVCSRDNDTVQVIAANGTRYKTLLVSNDGVKKPFGIAFRPTDSTLIVSLVDNNEVLAFKLA